MNKKFVKALAVLSLGSILGTNVAYASEPLAYKNETVYTTKEDGKVKDKTVSVWIDNENKEKIKDKSDLVDIKNLENDQKIETKDGFINIDNKEKDFYYQGKTQKDLPVDVDIRYELDGKEIKFSELEGKTGRLKITIKATNKVTENIDSGKNIYAPYLVMTEMTFDDSEVKNIESDSAKIVKDGKNQIVAGILTPGLRENFDGILDSDKLDKFKDEIEIEMDVENFHPGEVYALISNEFFQDGKNLSSLDNLDEGIGELTSNADKLVDASGKLKDGSARLNSGLSDLDQGAQKLADGSGKLKTSFDQMAQAFASLPDQIGPMTDAVGRLNAGGENLNLGINQYTQGVSEINSKMDDLRNAAESLESGAESLYQGLDKLSKGTGALKKELSHGLGGSDLESFSTSLLELKTGIDDFSKNISPMADSLNKINLGLESASKSQSNLAASIGKLNEMTGKAPSLDLSVQAINAQANSLDVEIKNLEAKNEDGSLTDQIASLRAIRDNLYGQAQSLGTNAQVNAGIYENIASLSQGSNELAKSLEELSQGLGQMSEKLNISKDQLATASRALSLGAEKFEEGFAASDLAKLAKVIDDMDHGLGELKEGSEKLKDGTMQNKEGVEKLAQGLNLIDSKSEDLKGGSEKLSTGLGEFKERSKALAELGSINEKAINPMSKGIGDLNQGILELRAGALKLKEGSDTYKESFDQFDAGLRRYKTEGIDKIAGKTGDLEQAKQILDKMNDLAKKNNSISGSSDELETRSRIIEKIK